MEKLVAVVNTAVTYIVAAVVGLTAAAGEIAEAAPEGSETAIGWLLRAAAWLVGAVAVIRGRTPVPAEARGLTMPADRHLRVEVIGVGAPSSVLETDKAMDDVQTRKTQAKWRDQVPPS